MNQNYYQLDQNAAALNQRARQIVDTERRSCFKCRWEGDTAQKSCPRCGRRLFTRTNIRVRGGLLVGIGLFLSGFMTVITIFVTAVLADAVKKPGINTRLEEEPHMFVMIYLIFAGIIAAGGAITLNGLWMLIFGRRNMLLFWIFIGLLVVTFIVGRAFTALAH